MTDSVKQLLLYHDLILSVVAAMEARDFYTACHSMRVAEMTEALCGFLNLPEDEQTVYHIAAHLHDVGKIGIQDKVLRKDSKLNDEEWAEMKNHTVIGYDILHKIDSFSEIAQIVRAHHERYDGNGYPDRLLGIEIPIGSRIIAVADSIDAMLSTRPYREAKSNDFCKSEIEANSGKMYDPQVTQAALSHWDELLSRRSDACKII